MDNQSKPQMSISQKGEKYKVLKVSGNPQNKMPLHIATGEAVIFIEKGEALLGISDKEITLKAGDSQIIPAMQPHTLLIKDNFQAIVIMGIESEIKFIESN
jgi:quercetin dioxygenase-like cupin family protein